jgi:hypothetical protein
MLVPTLFLSLTRGSTRDRQSHPVSKADQHIPYADPGCTCGPSGIKILAEE